MSKDMFAPELLEDEPCDSCGVRPSRHLGHGAFTCKACYDAWWCPSCAYRLGPDHVCVTPEQRAIDREKYEVWLLVSDDPDAAEQEIIKLRHRVAELEDTIRLERASGWQHSSCGRDEAANRMLDGIEERRGKDWTGAFVTNEPACNCKATIEKLGNDARGDVNGHFAGCRFGKEES